MFKKGLMNIVFLGEVIIKILDEVNSPESYVVLDYFQLTLSGFLFKEVSNEKCASLR